MAGRLGRQIATLKAMSKIDRLILSGAEFEEVAEDVIDHLIKLTEYESANTSRPQSSPGTLTALTRRK
jgi:hypothetical protein